MNITVIGAGYVGLVTGTCFAELGNHVTCIDINEKRVELLRKGVLPIYEPGLDALVMSNIEAGRLEFCTTLNGAAEPRVIFIAVGTPSDKEGSADMRYVLDAARSIGATLTKDCIIVDKSTVPVGMADQVKETIQEALNDRGITIHFDVVSNPEFLREGAAINDFMQPDRIIIGHTSEMAKATMLELYTPILRAHPEKIYFMSVKDAEMTKYAANAMLATKISFMNEMSVLCERLGVDIDQVRIGIGSDSRIGSAFIYPGCGYGGSCFPKDVKALIKIAEEKGIDPMLLRAVEERNHHQKLVLPKKIQTIFGEDLSDVKIGIWGLSFKPETDDMREASSLVLLEEILVRNASVQAYDPVAMPMAKNILPQKWMDSKRLIFTEHQYDAVNDVDALILVTEWKPFCYPDLAMMKKLMRRCIVIDGRNQYDPKQMKEAGFEYYGIGRGTAVPVGELYGSESFFES
jgi:UDPglucose 6-dehydrogenase